MIGGASDGGVGAGPGGGAGRSFCATGAEVPAAAASLAPAPAAPAAATAVVTSITVLALALALPSACAVGAIAWPRPPEPSIIDADPAGKIIWLVLGPSVAALVLRLSVDCVARSLLLLLALSCIRRRWRSSMRSISICHVSDMCITFSTGFLSPTLSRSRTVCCPPPPPAQAATAARAAHPRY